MRTFMAVIVFECRQITLAPRVHFPERTLYSPQVSSEDAAQAAKVQSGCHLPERREDVGCRHFKPCLFA